MNVVITAGGTGGHLYPAVALAEEFLRQEPLVSITFVGTGRGMEEAMLAQSGFQLEHINTRGVIGRGTWASIKALLLVPQAIWHAMRLLKTHGADLVIGTGGYTSPPVVIAAFLLGIKRVLLEPNAFPGIANRVLGPLAHRVFLSFERAKKHFTPSKVRIIGTPVRKAFGAPRPPRSSPQVKTLLVFGGSQGAQAINTAMIEALTISRMIREDLTVIHQTGRDDEERVRAAYVAVGVQAEVVPFLFEMPRALQSADLVISRAGALTLAELAFCGKAAILIPFPHAAHQHQEKNARAVERAGAAVVLPQPQLSGQRLAEEIERLIKDPDRLRMMAERSFALRRTDAAEVIVRECRMLLAE